MIVYLDVDEVLADFHGAACRAHGWNPEDPKYKVWEFFNVGGLSPEQFWSKLDNYEFWIRVPELLWAEPLVTGIRALGHTIVYCSCPSNSSEAHKAKRDWLQHRPWYKPGEEILLMGHKERLACPDAVLIDDRQESVDAFRKAGGAAIVFPAPWNDCRRDPAMADVETVLAELTDHAYYADVEAPSTGTLLARYEKQRQADTIVGINSRTYDECKVTNKLAPMPVYDGTKEIRVVNEKTGGEKGAKLADYSLLPVEPLRQLAELYGVGSKKYARRNWEKGYDWHLSFAALMRHAWLFWGGEDLDSETKCHHMASVCFHALALIEFGKTHPELDDRPVEGKA